MFSRLKNSLLFRLEQTMVRGPAARFALYLILVVLVATVAGLLARALAPGFESAVDASGQTAAVVARRHARQPLKRPGKMRRVVIAGGKPDVGDVQVGIG
jgi:hypothetical protein